jgi:A/G-specific adenine glycosylase
MLFFSVNLGFREMMCTFADMFATTLLEWFRKNARDLPWRHTTDPYAIWLSEIILQQTRIQQGLAYWERFMKRWPSVEALAAATEDEVLREWQGLGYYSRARNLHHAAKQIVALGSFPTTLEDIKKLKGVGDYTAAAIASFAFGLPAAVVDGNVYRVLSRYFGIDTPINTTEGKKVFAVLAQDLLPITQPQSLSLKGELEGASAYNQAIMDFGALQCTPQSPDCMGCPLMESCEAFRSGRVGELPVKLKTLKVKERHLIYIYIRCNGETAIRRRGPGDIWQGLWEPVAPSDLPTDVEAMQHARCLKKNVKHVLTHQVLYADFYLLETENRPVLPDDYIWIKESELDDYAKPRLIEILLQKL